MANVFRIQLKLAGGDRAPSELYTTNLSTIEGATGVAEELCVRRAALLGGGAVLSGYRLSSRDAGTTKPTGILRVRTKNLASPLGDTGDRNSVAAVGVVCNMVRMVTAAGIRSRLYLALPPSAVAATQFLLQQSNVIATPSALVTAWRADYDKFATFLQGNANSMSVNVLVPPANPPQIVGITSGVLGPTNVLIAQVSGDATATFVVGRLAQIKGLRFLGTRRRPADRTYRIGKSVSVPATTDFQAHTDIYLMCSDPLLAGIKPCAFGTIAVVSKLYDTITSVAGKDDLFLTGHRRGSTPFVQHRGTPRIRVSTGLLTLAGP